MSARRKLNAIHVSASLIVASIARLVTNSWAVFLVGTGIMLALNCYSCAIRPRGRGRGG